MARPSKQTVDYFSHDAHASNGRTVTILENHFGADGYAAWFKLLEHISVTNNHVINLNNGEDIEFLAAKLRLKPERLTLILDKMADLGAIDTALYREHQIIWCQNFVDRLADVYLRRKQQLPGRPLLDNKTVNTDINIIKTAVMPLLLSETPQSKLKETKLNKTKVNKQPAVKKTIDQYFDELIIKYPELDKDTEKQKFSFYWEGKTIKRPGSAVINWLEKAREIKKEKTNGFTANRGNQSGRLKTTAELVADNEQYEREHGGPNL